jgi:NAD(P)-dependent dehydrogenase (short-subunit alcohol dehydrogenase family)
MHLKEASMAQRLAGKVAIITGGSGGIGSAAGRVFHRHGASVVLVDLDQAALRQAAAEIDPAGERVAWIDADLTAELEAERVVQKTVERFGTLNVLANVAAVREYGPITEATVESWQRILNVNLLASAYCAKFAIRAMEAAGGGSVINVSSGNAMVGRGGMALYDASKSALLALTRSMACDHAEAGVRVNTISPGPTLTSFHIRRRMADTGEAYEEAEAAIRAKGAPGTLLGRQAEPEEIANAMLFLASDESSYVTGANIPVDGGLKGLRA